MNRVFAALEIDGYRLIVPSRHHVYHGNQAAAARNLERRARRLNAGARGLIWPADSSYDDALAAGKVYTIAL